MAVTLLQPPTGLSGWAAVPMGRLVGIKGAVGSKQPNRQHINEIQTRGDKLVLLLMSNKQLGKQQQQHCVVRQTVQHNQQTSAGHAQQASRKVNPTDIVQSTWQQTNTTSKTHNTCRPHRTVSHTRNGTSSAASACSPSEYSSRYAAQAAAAAATALLLTNKHKLCNRNPTHACNKARMHGVVRGVKRRGGWLHTEHIGLSAATATNHQSHNRSSQSTHPSVHPSSHVRHLKVGVQRVLNQLCLLLRVNLTVACGG